MTNRQRVLLYISLGLLAAALILLTINRWIPTKQQLNTAVAKKIPEWQSFPTRAVSGTLTPHAVDIESAIRLSILRQEYTEAYSLISEAETRFPDNTHIWLYKVRLALAQNDYSNAETLVWEAIGLDSTNALSWALAGSIFSHNGKSQMAEQAFTIALELNPDLASHLFRERWAFAEQNNDAEKLTELADEYYMLHPGDPIADYYLASALRSSGQNSIALYLLVDRLSDKTQSPAILWYTLGLAYLDRGSFSESAIAFEHSLELLKAGDTTMHLVSMEPENIIVENLAKAYLGFERCVSAEALFRRLADKTNADDYTNWIAEAVTCQTPTPTPTHWMISRQN